MTPHYCSQRTRNHLRRLGWVALMAFSASCSRMPESAPPLSQQASQASCEEVPAWKPGARGTPRLYQRGTLVQNRGQMYACTSWGSQGFCEQAAFEPGTATEHLWGDAWESRGSCTIPDARFKGNRITLELPAKPPGASIDTITGTLRCPGANASIRSFSGKWAETVNVDELDRCDYQLYIAASGNQVPLNTPAILPLIETEKQVVTFIPQFRKQVDLDALVLAPGIKISIFATGLLQPRQMAMGKNVLYVGSSSIPHYAHENRIADFIYALPLDAQGNPSGTYVLQDKLQEPHGVAYRDGDLYYSTAGGLYRIRNVDDHLDNPTPELVLRFPADDTRKPLPTEADGEPFRIWHQKHPLYFNPYDPSDRSLYTAVGIPCNVCMIPQDDRYGTVLKYDLDSKQATILATGVRNSVGMAWHPDTGQLWFSDNNRQLLDNSDEINRISRNREFFGVPYVFGKATIGYTRHEFDNPEQANEPALLRGAILSDLRPEDVDVRRQTAPVYPLANNSAPLGIHFWTHYPSPDGARQLLVAQHGGGTADDPSSDVRMLTIVNNQVVHDAPLITGWKPASGPVTGKAVDFLELADGSLLISDDLSGVIYKVTYAPTGLPSTTLAFSVAAHAPAPQLADAKASGVLQGPDGKRRLVQLAWGAPALRLEGLPPGPYSFEMRDAGTWEPVTRTQYFQLTADGSTHTIPLDYHAPTPAEADIIITAPDRPAGVTASSWTVHLKVSGQAGEGDPIEIPWGTMHRQTVARGSYSVVYPYFDSALPVPTLDVVRIDAESGDQSVAPTYKAVDSLGQTMLTTTCINCHQPRFWDDAARAERWDAAGVDALISKIRSMGVPGHCDHTCASATARYLLDDVWGEFLNPPPPTGTRQVRLLASDEYVNAVRDVFKYAVSKGEVPPENSYKEFKYPAPATEGILRKDALYQYYLLARKVAQAVDLDNLGYTPGGDDTAFVTALGRRAFRRPLQPDEITRYKAVLQSQAGDMEGPRLMVASLLMSPNFLYRHELGQLAHDGSGQYQLDAYEIATALSFTYLGTTPDDALLAKAENGELATSEQIVATATEMMQSPAGLAQFERFIRYYARTLQEVGEKPGLPRSLINAMAQEQALAVGYLMSQGSGNVRDLFNPGYTYLNEELAQHYGIGGVTGEMMQRVTIPAGGVRGGLLHQGLFQITQSGQDNSGLIARGFRIREQFFCHSFGTPIADPGNPEFPNHGVTTRYRWDLINGRYADQTCWNCHKYVNDTGASMENYDWTGKFRTQEYAVNPPYTEQLLDLDPSLDFRNGSDTGNWGTNLANVRGIAELIPDNPAALSCLADGYIRYSMGTEVTANMLSLHTQLRRELMSDGDLRRMLRDVAASPAFTRRTEIEPSPRRGPPPPNHY